MQVPWVGWGQDRDLSFLSSDQTRKPSMSKNKKIFKLFCVNTIKKAFFFPKKKPKNKKTQKITSVGKNVEKCEPL